MQVYARDMLLSVATLAVAARLQAQVDSKIPLSPAMVVNETTMGDATLLVDEQQRIGDPLNGNGEVPKTSWFAGWGGWQYPVYAFIDLGATYRLSSVFLYDTTGSGKVEVFAGRPFAWKPLVNDGLPNYQQWNRHDVDVETRYLRVSIGAMMLEMPELVVYGHKVKDAPRTIKKAKPVSRVGVPMEQFIGTNAFIDDPLDVMAVGGFAREYHVVGWDIPAGQPELKAWAPSAAGGGAWNFDTYYSELKRRGVTVSPCLQSNFPGWGDGEDKPVPAGADAEDPRSYRAHAEHMFQYAARYGSSRVADSRLRLAPDQKRVSGLGLLRYFENWNEPDKNWRGRAANFTAYEMAAMGSADRDGHMGALGRDAGIKNADPQAKLVLGGLAGIRLDYLKVMKIWSDWNRKGQFPYDVINLHYYCNAGGDQAVGLVKQGVSPEAAKLKEKMRAVVQWRDENVPQAEVWMTEFGYDINQASPQRAPTVGTQSPEQVQANWLVRSYLELAAAGIDRAAMYMLRDVEATDPTQFSSSGLVTKKGEWKRRPSWYYVATLKNRLAGMRFVGEVATKRADVRVYRFQGAKSSALVAWCPTSDDRRVTYKLQLPAGVQAASQVQFQDGKVAGVAQALQAPRSVVALALSEKPTLVLYNEKKPVVGGKKAKP